MPMIQSMTGFGSAERGFFRVEIRSLNHRFLDISVRMPQQLGHHEIALRNRIRERFARGRFDLLVSTTGEAHFAVKIHKELAREICNALRTLKDELSLSGDVGVETIAGFRELIIAEVTEYDTEPLYAALSEAMEMLQDMRKREGEALGTDMLSRLERVAEMRDRIGLLSPEGVDECRKKFIERLRSLLGEVPYDDARVLQEAAMMAEKMDISEEITRLGSHITQMRKILSDGDTIGRKVEFLLQEFSREVNTIASKADDSRISGITVDMKAELEKMREQAQNIQ
jgi:uncharacterized protein (TIGR00255 family)